MVKRLPHGHRTGEWSSPGIWISRICLPSTQKVLTLLTQASELGEWNQSSGKFYILLNWAWKPWGSLLSELGPLQIFKYPVTHSRDRKEKIGTDLSFKKHSISQGTGNPLCHKSSTTDAWQMLITHVAERQRSQLEVDPCLLTPDMDRSFQKVYLPPPPPPPQPRHKLGSLFSAQGAK